jgi:hypothetical protein
MRMSFLPGLVLFCCLAASVKAGDGTKEDKKNKKEDKLIVHVSLSHLLQKAGIKDLVAKKAVAPTGVFRGGLMVHYASGGSFACAVCSTPQEADAILNRQQQFIASLPPESVEEKIGDASMSAPTFIMFRYRNVFVYFSWPRKTSLPLQRIRDIDAFLKTPSKEVKYGKFKELPKISAHLKKVKVVSASETKPSRIHLLLSTDFKGLGTKPLFSIGGIAGSGIPNVRTRVKSDGTIQVVLTPRKEDIPLKNYPITIRASGDGLVFAEETITVDFE